MSAGAAEIAALLGGSPRRSPSPKKGKGKRGRSPSAGPTAKQIAARQLFAKRARSPEFKAKARAAKALAAAQRSRAYESLARGGRGIATRENIAVGDMKAGKARNKAGKALIGGSPLKDLLAYQRAALSRQRLNTVRVPAEVSVQLKAQQTKIKNAAQCLAAIEAARRASRSPHNPLKGRSLSYTARRNELGITRGRVNQGLAKILANM